MKMEIQFLLKFSSNRCINTNEERWNMLSGLRYPKMIIQLWVSPIFAFTLVELLNCCNLYFSRLQFLQQDFLSLGWVWWVLLLDFTWIAGMLCNLNNNDNNQQPTTLMLLLIHFLIVWLFEEEKARKNQWNLCSSFMFIQIEIESKSKFKLT